MIIFRLQKRLEELRCARLSLQLLDLQLENVEAGLIFYPRLTLPWCGKIVMKHRIETEWRLLSHRIEFLKRKTRNHYWTMRLQELDSNKKQGRTDERK